MIWGAVSSGKRELGELWTHTGIIILGPVFIHDRDLIIASWDTFNLKQREIRKTNISPHVPSFVIVG